MTADADATPRPARRGRSPFELLRFSATPVPGALVVVEIEGRVAAASGRFARRPVLVVEPSADRPRLELAPARATLDGDRWQAAYAIPAEAYDAANFALGLRGTLLDLPAPDEPDAADRQTRLSREANAVRRQLEAAEADVAAARAEALAAAGELGAAVSAARDEALAESAERVAELDREAAAAHEEHTAELAAKDQALADAVAANDAAAARARADHEAEATRAQTEREAEATRARDEHDAEMARVREEHAEALADKERALAEEIAAHEAVAAQQRREHAEALATKDRQLREDAEAHAAELATLRGERDDEAVEEEQRRRVADAQARALIAEEGIGVLRAELAEERERFQTRIAELEQEALAAASRLEALRRTAEADAPAAADDDPDATRALRPLGGAEDGAGDDDPDATRVLHPVDDDEDDTTGDLERTQVLGPARAHGHGDGGGDEDDTRPFTAKEEREAGGEPVLPLERGALPRVEPARGVGAYVAVAALVGFVLVLLVLLGFLG